MPRGQRHDEPGAWHHIFNRGVARRTLFESERDVRKFLSLFARAARAGRIEVHAYCVVVTHFHFLVRSPVGQLSAAMQWIQNQYVRWFNRGRRRDGPLLRGRFGSKRADSLVYRCHLVRYIDFNAVDAGLVAAPALYRHGSAWHYARPRGPRWLTRSWIESEVAASRAGGGSRAAVYASRFGRPLPPALLAWVEQRASSPRSDPDGLDDLIAAAPERVLAWMRRKSSLADGAGVGVSLCTPASVDEVVERLRATRGDWLVALERRRFCAYMALEIGLLRTLCASTLNSAAHAVGISRSSALNFECRHNELLSADPDYSAAASTLALEALRTCHQYGARANFPR